MKFLSSFVRLIVVIGLVLALGSNIFIFTDQASAQSQSDTTKFCMIGPQSVDTFPEMQFSFRAFDTSTYEVPQNLLASEISVIDNGKAVNPRALSQFGDLGINIVFVIDQGNRTDIKVTKAILERFTSKYMVDGLDQVSILTTLINNKRSNAWTLLNTTNSVTDAQSAISEISDKQNDVYIGIDDTLREAINKVQAANLDCKTPSMVVVIMGPDEISGTQTIQNSISNARSIGVPIHVLHVERNGFQSEATYRKLASESGGLYFQVPRQVPDEYTVIDQSVFNFLKLQRTRYEAALRLPDGASEHVVSINFAGMSVQTQENTTRFNVALDNPVVSILTPTNGYELSRTAQQKIETGFVYDIDSQLVQFEVQWRDFKPRQLTSAELIVTTSAGPVTVSTFNPLSTPLLEFNWDIREFIKEGQNDATLQVRVIDEYGYEGISEPVQVRILNVIPQELTEVMIVENPVTKYMVYGLLLVVLILLILLGVFWRKLNTFMKSGAIGQMVAKVRKTIVGGSRKNPLAVLVILEGPQKLINEELKVFTESVILGRDPTQADFTFYADSNSSVSGKHAKLEKSNGQWHLHGISMSGNETFLDDQPIPNFQAISIHNGQRIRMGYPGQQPVELEFREVGTATSDQKLNSGRKTKVGEQNTPSFSSEFEFGDQEPASNTGNKQSSKAEDADSFFESFRDRK